MIVEILAMTLAMAVASLGGMALTINYLNRKKKIPSQEPKEENNQSPQDGYLIDLYKNLVKVPKVIKSKIINKSKGSEFDGEIFGKGKEKIRDVEWDWDNFESTEDYPVSENLLDWVIGQDKALEECYLCLDEWVHKLTWMKEEEWYKAWKDPKTEKPQAKKFIPAGPYLLLLGDAGTGKSLMGRALANYLTDLYKNHNIQLQDVVCWQNEIIPSEPRVSCHPAGEGKKLVRKEKLKSEKKSRLKKIGIRAATYFMTTIALLFVSIGLYWMWGAYCDWLDNVPVGFGGFAQDIPLMDWMMNKFIGIGGITTTADAVEFLLAGAKAVQVGTACFIDPRAPLNIIEGLRNYLVSQGEDDINNIIGTVKPL